MTVTFPLRKVDRDELPSTAQPAQCAPPNETILVVDDDDDMRWIAATMLKRLGYNVITAGCCHAALEILGAGQAIDLLLSDVDLGDAMDGCQLAGEARDLRAGVRILLMSGYAEDLIVRHRHLNAGLAFIPKPFNKRDFTNKVRAVLDAPPPKA